MEELSPNDGDVSGLSWVTDLSDRTDLFELLSNDDVVRLSGLASTGGFSSADAVWKSTGVLQRRILRPGVTPLRLAELLLMRMQDQTGLQCRDVEALLVWHSGVDSDSREQLKEYLLDHFGNALDRVSVSNYGCSGFLRLLQDGCQRLDQLQTGRILLLNIETPEAWHDGSDRLFCGIVAAGAAAAILQKGEGWRVRRVAVDDFVPDPQILPNADPLFRKERGLVYSFRGEQQLRTVMRMNAESVFLCGIEFMLQSLRAAVTTMPADIERRVIVVPHQPSGKLLKALIAAARQEYPNFVFVNNLRDYGNMISAGIPVILSRLPEVLAQNQLPLPGAGDLIILLAAGICMDHPEQQMTAGYAVVEWAPLCCQSTQVAGDLPSARNSGSQSEQMAEAQ